MALSARARKLAAEVAAGDLSVDAALSTASAELEAELVSPEFEAEVESARKLAHVADPDRIATKLLSLEQQVEQGNISEKTFARRSRVVMTAAQLHRRSRTRHG